MNQSSLSTGGNPQSLSHDNSSAVTNQVFQPQPKTHIKFHRNAVEVRKKVTLSLSEGTSWVSLGDIDDTAAESSFRLTILEGSRGVISSKISFRYDDIEQSPITSVSTNKREPSLSNAPQTTLSSRDTQQQVIQDLELSIGRAERGVQQASRLLLEWITQARSCHELEIDEWREGLSLLEDTLYDRVLHRHSLNEALSKIQQRNMINSSSALPSRQVLIELCVDKEYEYQLELSYRLPQAGWLPVYQARVDEELFEKSGTKPRVEARVHLDLSARYLQTTQETWRSCKAEFSLYPPVAEGFPVLNYPAYQSLYIESQRSTMGDLSIAQGLHSPWADLCRLFSDQASINLTLELDLSSDQPQVMVIGAGSLDTLLPIGDGIIHRFVGDEWIGSNPIGPLLLGEPLSMSFGLFAPLEASVLISPHQTAPEEHHKSHHNDSPDHSPDDSLNDSLNDSPNDSSDDEAVEHMSETEQQSESRIDTLERDSLEATFLFEQIEVSIKNLDRQVRTVLVSHPLSRGMLTSEDEDRPPNSAPVGWVLSANRQRLMRWVSIAPGRSERLSVLRKSEQ